MNNTPKRSPEETAQALRDAMYFIGTRLINREEIIEQIFYALLTREHVLLQSRTGVGKTLLAEQVFSMFHGARIFKVQASKEQQPDTYFGGLDIELLKTGKIIHNTDGSLVESEFGFIDEIFDANDFTLRALLSLLNERALMRGVQYKKASIHTVIAATNYLRVSETTEAILDRFLYKSVIIPDKNPFVQFKISQNYLKYSGSTATPPRTISFQELQDFYQAVCSSDAIVSIPSDILYCANLVIRQYEYLRNRAASDSKKTGKVLDYYVSTRTQAKALDLLRASALLEGRTVCTNDDIRKLHHIFATGGISEEKAIFTKAYGNIINTLSVSNGFDQLRIMLSFAELLEKLRTEPVLMHKPINEIDLPLARKTLVEWLKETFSKNDTTFERNKNGLELFLKEFIPVCDEIRELKVNLEKELSVVMAHCAQPR